MLTTSIVIPTYHRPAELETALNSILTQTRRPDELIVVDDGDLSELPLSGNLQQAGIHYRLVRKERPGLTESRNLGVSIATGDLIFFFDDDVELFPDYLEQVLLIFEQDTDRRIGGIGGIIVNYKPMTPIRRLRRLMDRFFLNSGKTEGKVLRSGFCTNFGATARLPEADYDVDFLPGAAFAFRREVFEHLRFSPGYHEAAIGEDKDFSYRIARRWRLVMASRAKLYHFESPTMRADPYETGRRFLLGRYLFFRDLVHRDWWDWLTFWYGCSGYLIIRTVIAAASRKHAEWEHLRGSLAGTAAILTGRTPAQRDQ